MSFQITGMGTAHPPDAVTEDESLALARLLAGPAVRTSTWLGPIYSHSGVKRRYQVIGGETKRDVLTGRTDSGSPFLPSHDNEGVGPTTAERMMLFAREAGPIALRAATTALAEASYTPKCISHLITVSCTGFAAPGIDFVLMSKLGMNPTVARTHVGFMGCHGALNGLRVASAFAAEQTARVLICAVELCSLHYYYGTASDKLIANAIFADGAAAIAGEQTKQPSQASGWKHTSSGSCLLPNSAEDMSWTIGNHGFEMSMSRRVPGLIAAHLRPWLVSWLHDHGLSLGDVRSWAIHPGGPKIITAVMESLELSPEAAAASNAVYSQYGNMSSPTVLFVLKQLRDANAPRPCVALGFGPGLVAEAALFE